MKRIFHFFVFLLYCLFLFCLYPFAKIALSHKKIWLISERKNEARDNGYSFFKYLNSEHKDINCFYVINSKSKDYDKVKSIGKVIDFGSFRHFLYFCAAKYIISTDTQSFCPNYYITLLRKKIHLPGKYVFLQHGITYNDQVGLYKENAKIDLFICACRPERDFILSKFGYSHNEAVLCGFARFDNYFSPKIANTLLIMPTWRRWIKEESLLESEYYKKWISFLNSIELNDFLLKNNMKAYFYAHPLFQKYVSSFTSKSDNLIVASQDLYDIQKLLAESKILITDYSSVFFDYAYMRKPILFYHFDYEKFYSSHYKKGYFDFERDSLGLIAHNENELIDGIRFFESTNYNIGDKIKNTVESFFLDNDSKNSERIYTKIVELTKKGRKNNEN